MDIIGMIPDILSGIKNLRDRCGAKKQVPEELDRAKKIAWRILFELQKLQDLVTTPEIVSQYISDILEETKTQHEVIKNQDKWLFKRFWKGISELQQEQGITKMTRRIRPELTQLWISARQHGLNGDEFQRIMNQIGSAVCAAHNSIEAFVKFHVSMEVNRACERIENQKKDSRECIENRLKHNIACIEKRLKNNKPSLRNKLRANRALLKLALNKTPGTYRHPGAKRIPALCHGYEMERHRAIRVWLRRYRVAAQDSEKLLRGDCPNCNGMIKGNYSKKLCVRPKFHSWTAQSVVTSQPLHS